MSIVEFLLARIAEDEVEVGPFVNELGEAARWECEDVGGVVRGRLGDVIAQGVSHFDAVHIARHDPARVLAECAAKRAIVEEHPQLRFVWWPEMEHIDMEVCATCSDDRIEDADGATVDFPCPTLCHLAAVYADHPEYDPAWRIDNTRGS